MEEKLKKLINQQLVLVTLHGRIPILSKLNNNDFEEIRAITKKRFLTKDIIKEIIDDFTFKETLKIKFRSDNRGEKKLTDYPAIDIEKLSEQISSFIISLPKKYFFIFKMPLSIQMIPYTKLAHNIELGSIADKKFKQLLLKTQQETPINSLSSIRGDLPRFKDNDVVLRISSRGYVSNYSKIKIDFSDPLYIFKVILGIYIALSIVRRKSKRDYFPFPTEFTYYVYDSIALERVRTVHESLDDTNYLNGLEFDKSRLVTPEMHEFLENKPIKFDDVNKMLRDLFSDDGHVTEEIDEKVKTYKHRRIKNGAYWFYESLKTKQEHIRTIYLTTAFDSLVETESSKEHKAGLITSAISYDVTDAELDKDGIIKLYSLRNDIVHGKVAVRSLNQYEESDSNNKIEMCIDILFRYLSNRIYFVSKEALYWP